jgi:uncharacterized protein YbaP (TraB family)
VKKQLLIPALIVLASLHTQADTCVWKAEKEGSTLYLGGTFHLLRPADFPLPPEFDAAYTASDLLVFETDMAAMQSVSTQLKIMQAAMYTDGTTLADHLKPETFKLISDQCEAKGLPVAFIKNYKPSIAMVTLMMLDLSELGVTEQGVDTSLHKRAVADNKPVLGLESVDEQIEMLLSMGAEDPDEFIAYSLKDLKTAKKEFPFMINAWKIGDTSGLEHFAIEPLKELPELYKSLIVDRNNVWLKKIPEWQQSPQVEFVLVGAAHLVGPDGILKALEKDGWNVEQLRVQPAQ